MNQKNPYLQLSDIESVEGLSPEFISGLKASPLKNRPCSCFSMKAPSPCAKPAVVAVRTQRRVSARSPAGTDRTISKSSRPALPCLQPPCSPRSQNGRVKSAYADQPPPVLRAAARAGLRKRDFRPEREKLLDAIVPLWSAPLTGLPISTLSTSVKWRGSSAKRTAKGT